jgi:hypothetical protein
MFARRLGVLPGPVDGMGRGREAGYINVSVVGNSAEAAAKYLTKGWLVAVDGRLEYGEWEIDTGGKRHDYSVMAVRIEVQRPPRASASRSQPCPTALLRRCRPCTPPRLDERLDVHDWEPVERRQMQHGRLCNGRIVSSRRR